jgi:hypothetical protein
MKAEIYRRRIYDLISACHTKFLSPLRGERVRVRGDTVFVGGGRLGGGGLQSS